MGYEMSEFKAKEVILGYNVKNKNKTCIGRRLIQLFLSDGRTNSFDKGFCILDECTWGFAVAKIGCEKAAL